MKGREEEEMRGREEEEMKGREEEKMRGKSPSKECLLSKGTLTQTMSGLGKRMKTGIEEDEKVV